jgi:hypothetical protein
METKRNAEFGQTVIYSARLYLHREQPEHLGYAENSQQRLSNPRQPTADVRAMGCARGMRVF